MICSDFTRVAESKASIGPQCDSFRCTLRGYSDLLGLWECFGEESSFAVRAHTGWDVRSRLQLSDCPTRSDPHTKDNQTTRGLKSESSIKYGVT